MFSLIITGQDELVLTHNEQYVADQHTANMSDSAFFFAALCHTHNIEFVDSMVPRARVEVIEEMAA